MNANQIYEERKSASLIIYELLIKINKKLKNLDVFDVERMDYLLKNACSPKGDGQEKENISIQNMNLVLHLLVDLKDNERLMNYLKLNDELFFNELNIKYSYICFYNKMFYSDIEHLIVEKMNLYQLSLSLVKKDKSERCQSNLLMNEV